MFPAGRGLHWLSEKILLFWLAVLVRRIHLFLIKELIIFLLVPRKHFCTHSLEFLHLHLGSLLLLLTDCLLLGAIH